MENKNVKILSMMLIVVLCAVAIALVGPGNAVFQEYAELEMQEQVVDENDREGDASSTIVLMVRDPRQMDGTAYAVVILPQKETQGQTAGDEGSNEAGHPMETQRQTMYTENSNADEHPRETQGQTMDKVKSNTLAIKIAFVLLIAALGLGVAVVYSKSKEKEPKNNKIMAFFVILVMVISIFTAMVMSVAPDNTTDDISSVNNATDITESSAVLEGGIYNFESEGPLEVSFEWDSEQGPPYAYETGTRTISSSESFNETIDGLSPETTYYYRLKAVGSDYTYYSRESSFTTPLKEETIYVHQAATGTGDGSSWENAYTDLEVAIEAADSTDEILVALSDDPKEVGLAIRLHKSESGDISIDETLMVGPNDTLEGSGTIDSDVVISGTHSPGHSPGITEITGDYSVTGTLEIEIGGVNPGPGATDPEDPDYDKGHDQVKVTGNVTLGGTLKVVLINDFVPVAGQTFDFIVLTDPDNKDILESFDGAEGLFGFGDGNLYFEIVKHADKMQLEVKQFGGGGLQLKELGTHAIGVGKVLCDYFSDINYYTGSLNNIDIFGLISGSVNFSISKDKVDVDLDGEVTVPNNGFYDDATLLTVALYDLQLKVGVAGFGIGITNGNLGIASIKSGDLSWTAVRAKDITATIALPGITAGVSNFAVEINKADGPGASALDWTKSVDMDPADGFGTAGTVDPGEALTPAVDMAIGFTSEYLRVSGKLTTLDIFGLITGQVNFALVRQKVDVDLDGEVTVPNDDFYDDATLLTFALYNLQLKVGTTGFGIDIANGNLAIASIKSGDLSWTAVRAANITASITLPGISADVSNIAVEINKAEGTGATALDWTTSVDMDPADGFGSAGTVDPGEALTPAVDMDIGFTSEYLRVGGSLTSLDIFGFVTGTVGFEITPKKVDVNADGNDDFLLADGDLKDADMVLLKLEVTSVFIGVPDSIGFSLTSGMLALAAIQPSDPVADDRSWLAVSASVTGAELTGIAGLTASGGFDVEVNQAFPESEVSPVRALDWTSDVNLDNDSVDGDPFTEDGDEVSVGGHKIEHTTDFLQASGDLTVNLFDFVRASVSFEFVQQKVDVDVNGNDFFDLTNDSDLDNADMVMIDLQVKDVFAGIPDGIGFTMESGFLSLAAIKPSDPADDRSWLAASASVTNAELKGIEGLTAVGSLAVEINQAFSGPVVAPDDSLDWSSNIDTSATSVDNSAFTGGTVSVGGHAIELSGDLLEATGDLTLDLLGFFYVDGSFTFKKISKTVTVTDGASPVPNVDDVEVDLLTVGVVVNHAFAGMNGPYWREDTNTNGMIDPGETND
ncbi:MAG: fibronectin type III domain-containing protein, partial [Thermoplasmata archaeon]